MKNNPLIHSWIIDPNPLVNLILFRIFIYKNICLLFCVNGMRMKTEKQASLCPPLPSYKSRIFSSLTRVFSRIGAWQKSSSFAFRQKNPCFGLRIHIPIFLQWLDNDRSEFHCLYYKHQAWPEKKRITPHYLLYSCSLTIRLYLDLRRFADSKQIFGL